MRSVVCDFRSLSINRQSISVIPLSTSVEPLPQIVLKPRKALPFFSRHPWVFQGAVGWLVGEPQPGSVVDVVDDRQRFVARGLFNPQSQICVRLYSWDAADAFDEGFWSRRKNETKESRMQRQ